MKTGYHGRDGGRTLNLWAALCALGTVLAASPAAARYIAIDSTPPTPIGFCTIGAPCAANDLGLSLPAFLPLPGEDPNVKYEINDLGPFDSLYIYGQGVVSFGAPLPDDADVSDPSTLGSAFAAPGLADYGATLEKMAVVHYPDVDDSSLMGLAIYWFLNDPADSIFALYLVDNPALNFCPPGTNACFGYGASFAVWHPDVDPYLPAGAHVGFPGFTANGFSPDVLADDDPHFQGNVDFDGVIPEPTTWALLILGFAAAGAGLRRQRTQAARVA